MHADLAKMDRYVPKLLYSGLTYQLAVCETRLDTLRRMRQSSGIPANTNVEGASVTIVLLRSLCHSLNEVARDPHNLKPKRRNRTKGVPVRRCGIEDTIPLHAH